MAFNAYTTAYYLRPSVLCTLYILFFHRGNWQYILIIHHNTYATSRFAVNTVFEIIIIYIYIYIYDIATTAKCKVFNEENVYNKIANKI